MIPVSRTWIDVDMGHVPPLSGHTDKKKLKKTKFEYTFLELHRINYQRNYLRKDLKTKTQLLLRNYITLYYIFNFRLLTYLFFTPGISNLENRYLNEK